MALQLERMMGNSWEKKMMAVAAGGNTLEIETCSRPGPEPAILYLHGLGCAKENLAETIRKDELGGHRLAAFDFPGCGHSPYPTGTALAMDDLLSLTHAWIATLGVTRPILVGHSMGGLAALLYCERFPGEISAFINIEGNLAPEDCFLSRKVMKRPLNQWEKIFFRAAARNMAQSENGGTRIMAADFSRAVPRAIHDYSPSIVEYTDHHHPLEIFTSLKIPRLFIHGELNRHFSYLPVLKRTGIPVSEIPGAGHFPFHDNPRALYMALTDFLKANGS